MILTPFLPVPAQIFHAALLSAGRWCWASSRGEDSREGLLV
jgi:hypothetical protein